VVVELRCADGSLVAWSKSTARDLLAGMDQRLAHVLAVGRRAEQVAEKLPAQDRCPLVVAALLHDIGYAEALRTTGLHPLDGARWLRCRGVDRRVCNLVAHHSTARFEAEERGLRPALEEFDLEAGRTMDALDFADMTTGPDGRYVAFDWRIDDILGRYPSSDPVHRAMLRARPVLREAIERTLRLLAADDHPMYGAQRPSR
jgi:putative nucleotidyltransferase with HDIG domain